MAKYVCVVCGYVHEGDAPPEECPTCKAPTEKFKLQEEDGVELVYADEHVIGVVIGAEARIVEGLRQNFQGECTEVGMYLAMSRAADREGYPEIADTFRRYAFEEAEHAGKCAELLGEVVSESTKKNLEARIAAEHGACKGKKELAKLAKELGLDAVHDTIHEMARDEARHGKGFRGLLKHYFNK